MRIRNYILWLPLLLLVLLAIPLWLLASMDSSVQVTFMEETGDASVISQLKYNFVAQKQVSYMLYEAKGKTFHSTPLALEQARPEELPFATMNTNLEMNDADMKASTNKICYNEIKDEDDLNCSFALPVQQLHYSITVQVEDVLLQLPFSSLTVERKDQAMMNTRFIKSNKDSYGLESIDLQQRNESVLQSIWNNQNGVIMDEAYYFFISEASLDLNMEKFQLRAKEDVGGLYRAGKDGKAKRLTPMELGKEDIYEMKESGNGIVCLVKEGESIFLKNYSAQGVLQQKKELPKADRISDFQKVDGYVMITTYTESGDQWIDVYDEKTLQPVYQFLSPQISSWSGFYIKDGIMYYTGSSNTTDNYVIGACNETEVLYEGYFRMGTAKEAELYDNILQLNSDGSYPYAMNLSLPSPWYFRITGFDEE